LTGKLIRGRESATVYHRGKYAIAGAVALLLFVYVCMPIVADRRNGAGMIGVLEPVSEG
jgi:hypothetical protein